MPTARQGVSPFASAAESGVGVVPCSCSPIVDRFSRLTARRHPMARRLFAESADLGPEDEDSCHPAAKKFGESLKLDLSRMPKRRLLILLARAFQSMSQPVKELSAAAEQVCPDTEQLEAAARARSREGQRACESPRDRRAGRASTSVG